MEIAPQTIVAGRYRILRELGRGGMGVVYAVEHIHTGDHLAMKLLLGTAGAQAELVERFKREARASSRIRSEHVVKVVDADTAPELGGAPYLVMELLDGSDLENLLAKQGRIAPQEVVRLLSQAARALDKSHGIGIVHRDLKPENLFLHHLESGQTTLKIVDFGISKLVDANSDMAGAGMTKTGAVMGTPLYMSPEQARGQTALIGPATDIWAMGLIVIHLLTGEIYWRANTIAELMVNILAEPLYNPSGRWASLPPAIDAWFFKSCNRDPAQRFATVGAQIDALSAVIEGLSASNAPGASDGTPRRSASHENLMRATNDAVARSGAGIPTTRFPMILLAVPAAVIAGVSFFAYKHHSDTVGAATTAMSAATGTDTSVTAVSSASPSSTMAISSLAPIASAPVASSSASAVESAKATPPARHGGHTPYGTTAGASGPAPEVATTTPASTATLTAKPTATGRLMPVAP